MARARILAALLVVAAVKQVFLVVAVAPFQGHDEVAHLGYLWTIDRYRRLPTLADNLPAALEAYSRYTLDWPALYTANHPPLYYLLAWPVYRLAGPHPLAQLYAVRLLGILPFLLTVWLAYRLATTLFPGDDFLALTVPAAVAFQPQLGFEGAIVNNDILSVCLGAALLWLCAAALRAGLTPPRALALGVALGLGLLTKATLTAFLPLAAGVGLWCRWPRPWRRVREGAWWRGTLARAAAVIGPAVLLPLPWYLFLRRTYGDLSAARALQALQATWNPPAGSFGELLLSEAFHRERIHEYWGFYGWKLFPLTPNELHAVHAGLLLCGIGLLVGVGRVLYEGRLRLREGCPPVDGAPAAAVALLFAANVLLYGLMIYLGTVLFITQSRYIFPVVAATAMVAMLGLRALVPRPLLGPAAALTIATLAMFNLLLLTKLLIPYALR
ncbi:MAG: hypothetical protein M3Q65_14625 [Chloroflexota bacterium]|nr:hypothetical protein [Chloroflexota bacterium]